MLWKRNDSDWDWICSILCIIEEDLWQSKIISDHSELLKHWEATAPPYPMKLDIHVDTRIKLLIIQQRYYMQGVNRNWLLFIKTEKSEEIYQTEQIAPSTERMMSSKHVLLENSSSQVSSAMQGEVCAFNRWPPNLNNNIRVYVKHTQSTSSFLFESLAQMTGALPKKDSLYKKVPV